MRINHNYYFFPKSKNELTIKNSKPKNQIYFSLNLSTNSARKSKTTIAIIGGGPGGVSILIQLLSMLKENECGANTEILIFERSNNIGFGLPYSSEDNCYILNLPKEIMEPISGQSENFSSWLATIDKCPKETQYPPRHYFGKYLEKIFNESKSTAESCGVLLKYYTKCEVYDVEKKKSNEFILHTPKGKFISEIVILCTGHLISSSYSHLVGIKGYIHDPWKEESYTETDSNEDILIIGSRLTAIDCALKLLLNENKPHKGKIIMVSKSGLLPAVLAKDLLKIPPYTLKYLTLKNFNTFTKSGLIHLPLNILLDLFWKEISEAEGKAFNLNLIAKSDKDISPIEWLEKEINSSEVNQKTWQQVLFAIYPILPSIWNYLSFVDKKNFLDKYYSLFLTYLAAFPLENAYKILYYIKSGQLAIYGGLQNIESKNWQHSAILSDKVISTRTAINATGTGCNVLLNQLYLNMYMRNLIINDPLGGIKVNFQSLQVLNKDRKLNRSLYAVGDVTYGTCLATKDIGQLSIQASRVVKSIETSMHQQKSTIKLPVIISNTNKPRFFSTLNSRKVNNTIIARGIRAIFKR